LLARLGGSRAGRRSGGAGKQFSEEADVALTEFPTREDFADTVVCGLTHLPAECFIRYKPPDGFGKGTRVARRDHEAGLAVLVNPRGAGAEFGGDQRFAASDTLATSYVLGKGIQKIGPFDLILCGIRTTDSDTAQVGPQLAEELNVPHVTGVEKLERQNDLFRVERVSDGYREILEVSAPALFSISPKAAVRLPSLIEIEDAFTKNSIECWNLEDLKADPAKVGSAGSCTWVEALMPMAQQKSCVFIKGEPRQQAKSLFSKLIEKNVLS
jgi:electron transfer flavoprotein beta subunit